jgi:DNA-binding FrmR family transcriptional regulator
MAHTIRDKRKLLARVRRIKGQVAALERAIAAERECGEVMHLIASTRAAMAGLMAVVVEDHIREHLVDAERHPDALDQAATAQLLQVVRSYLK